MTKLSNEEVTEIESMINTWSEDMKKIIAMALHYISML